MGSAASKRGGLIAPETSGGSGSGGNALPSTGSRHAFGEADTPVPTRLSVFQSTRNLSTSVQRLTKYRSAIIDGYVVDPPELLVKNSCTWLQPLKASVEDPFCNIHFTCVAHVCATLPPRCRRVPTPRTHSHGPRRRRTPLPRSPCHPIHALLSRRHGASRF